MRLFGSQRISGIMQKLGLKEGEVMEHRWLNKSVETAQRRVEQQHFAIRKRTLEYDDVMNKQRTIIYELRGKVLTGDPASVHGLVLDVANDLVQSQAERYLFSPKDGSLEDFMSWLGVTFPVAVSEEELRPLMGTPGLAGDLVYKRVEEAYEAKCAGEDQEMLPFMERGVFLQVIDREWQDYLRAMDDLRQGVNLRAYGQRDPLVEYKKEAFSMFESLIATIKAKVVSTEFRSATAARMQRMLAAAGAARIRTNADEITVTESEKSSGPAEPENAASSAKTIGDVFASMMSRPRAAVPQGPAQMPGSPAAARAQPVVGRNDPCPCGSGKKFKKCCGRNMI